MSELLELAALGVAVAVEGLAAGFTFVVVVGVVAPGIVVALGALLAAAFVEVLTGASAPARSIQPKNINRVIPPSIH
jgi:hypothetical protein